LHRAQSLDAPRIPQYADEIIDFCHRRQDSVGLDGSQTSFFQTLQKNPEKACNFLGGSASINIEAHNRPFRQVLARDKSACRGWQAVMRTKSCVITLLQEADTHRVGLFFALFRVAESTGWFTSTVDSSSAKGYHIFV
jgi:hypothetical protein